MTDIELRQQGAIVPDQPAAEYDLVEWARQAEAAYMLAERICRTQMVPAAYRGKPDEACAAMLAGKELGFGPMASLRAFHPINGTPAPAAITLRAVVTGHGHDITVVESTSTRAEVTGRRKGTDNWQTSVWDIDRARLLPQFRTNKNYEQNPAAMLVARATAEVCRWIASDAVMGMPYAAEEIGDHPQLAPSPVAHRLTVAELDAAPVAPAAIEQAADDGQPVTDQQRKRMFALWGELRYAGDENRQHRLDITTKILGLTEPLESSNDLTRAEADQVIAALVERKGRMQGGAE